MAHRREGSSPAFSRVRSAWSLARSQHQSAEAVRRVREALIKAGGKPKADNAYGLELTNGSRVLVLPGSDSDRVRFGLGSRS